MKYTKQLLAAVVFLMPLLASAQLSHTVAITTQVPFEFAVGDRVIPAGNYIVQAANSASNTLLIRHADTTLRLFSSTYVGETREAPETDELVFHKYGDRYFLSAIRLEGSRVVYEIPESKEEFALRMRNESSTEETLHAN